MPLDFPNDPAVGDIFAGAGARWQWDGFKWTSLMTSGGPFLPLSGGALTGPLMLAADPVVALHAATKQYVDARGAGYLPLTGGTLAGPLTVEGVLEVTTGHLQLINDGSTEDAFAYVDLSADIGGMNLIRGHSPGFAQTWWTLALGDGPPSADFSITRYNDAGGIIDHPLTISRATGVVTFGPIPPSTMRRLGEAPGVTATAGVGTLQGHTVNGTVIQGQGSTNDFMLNNKNGAAVLSVPTGTVNLTAGGLLNRLRVGAPASAPGGNAVIGTSGAGGSLTTGNNNLILGGYSGASIAALSNNIIVSDGAGNIQMQYLSASSGWLVPSGITINAPAYSNVNVPTLRINGGGGAGPWSSGFHNMLAVTNSQPYTGTLTAGSGVANYASLIVANDQLTSLGPDVTCFFISNSFGGGATQGPRAGVNISLIQTGPTADTDGSNLYYTAFGPNVTMTANCGGSTGNAMGSPFAMNPIVTAVGGATFLTGLVPAEFDVSNQATNLTASMAGNTLTVTSINPQLYQNGGIGIVAKGMVIHGAGVTPANITGQTGGTTGGVGAYTFDGPPQTVASQAMQATNVMTDIHGISITQLGSHAAKGVRINTAIGVTNQAGSISGWTLGLGFGAEGGWWAIDPAGTMIGTRASIPGGPAYTAAWGMDLSAVAFSGGFLKSAGFLVDGAGNVTANSVAAPNLPVASTTNPLMDGAVAIGAAASFARADHVHPSDTARLALAGGTMTGGVSFGSAFAASNTDLSRHLALYGTANGISVSSGRFNVCFGAIPLVFVCNGADIATVTSTGFQGAIGMTTPGPGSFTTIAAANPVTLTSSLRVNGNAGFNNTAPIAKPTVSGAKASNAALASLITALANYGLITDTTTA